MKTDRSRVFGRSRHVDRDCVAAREVRRRGDRRHARPRAGPRADRRPRARARRRRRARARARRARRVRALTTSCRRCRPARSTRIAIRSPPRSARPLIARGSSTWRGWKGRQSIAHGCNGKANDELRLELGVARARSVDARSSRRRAAGACRGEQEIDYAQARKIPIPVDDRQAPSTRRHQPVGPLDRRAACSRTPWQESPEDIYALTRSPHDVSRRAGLRRGRVRGGVPGAGQRRRDAAHRADRERRDDRRRPRRRPHRHGRERHAGVKSREIYEAPAAVVLHTAHSELEKLVIPRDLERLAHDLGRAYADLVYNGRWFSPTREAIDAFMADDSAARHRRGPSETVQGRLPRRRPALADGARCRRRGASAAADPTGRLMAHLWSGRFAGDPDAELFAFGSSFRFDRRLFEDDVRAAWPGRQALARAGVLSRGGRRRDRRNGARADPRAGPAIRRSSTRRRTATRTSTRSSSASSSRAIGDAGRRLHTGRSRNEQVAVDLRLYLKRRVPAIQREIAALIDVLVAQADRAGDALMPSYTHLRRAQPVLVAHFLLSHAAGAPPRRRIGFARPARRGRRAAARVRRDRRHQLRDRRAGARGRARLRAAIARNSIDVERRSRLRRVVPARRRRSAMVHLSRIAEDFILFTSEEFGFFELADTAATGSSLMPQKKNPDPLELVRGKSGRVIGHLAGWLTTMKGLPSGTTRICRRTRKRCSTPRTRWMGCLRAAVDGHRRPAAQPGRHDARGVGPAARDRRRRLSGREGLPFRDAHEVVGALVRRLLDEGRSFDD